MCWSSPASHWLHQLLAAAAIVLCDLASTAYYIGGISEQAIGKAAPWFILGVMLFSYAVRAVYVESCTMFTRGGVYKVVKGAVGGGAGQAVGLRADVRLHSHRADLCRVGRAYISSDCSATC